MSINIKARPFAYNIGSNINGTSQVGNLAVGIPSDGFTEYPEFWNGPNEEVGYVIAYPQSNGLHHTPDTGNRLSLNPIYRGTDILVTNNGQTAYQQFGYQQSVLGNTSISDKVMFTVWCQLGEPGTLPNSHFIGIGYTSMNLQGNPYGAFPGNDTQSMGYCSDGNIYYNGGVYSGGLSTWGNGDVIDIAVDAYNSLIWVRVNNGYWNNNMSANPGTGTNGIESIGGPFNPVLCPGFEGTMIIQNTPYNNGTIPTGFKFLGDTKASVGFWRSKYMTDESFLSVVKNKTGQEFSTGIEAKTWLNNNGYWTSYLSPVLSLDAGNSSSYSGSGTVWTDLVGGKSFNLINGPSHSSGFGGLFNFNASSGQYAQCDTSLPNLSTWSIEVWHYYTGNNTGDGMCIITEVYPGTTSNINYSLGDNYSNTLSSGFFDGAWRATPGHNLTPNNWYHIVGTYDGTYLKLYVNNSLVESNAYSGTPISSNAGIRLMRRWDNPDYWDGLLATVDIYDDALNSSQISSLFNRRKSRFSL
jgi:hypothetical protein